MNLEFLLVLGCWFSTPPNVYTEATENACTKAGEGYYAYKKLDERVKEIERHIPSSFIFTATLLSSIEKRKASVPIYRGSYLGIEIPDNTNSRIIVGYEHGF